MDIERRFSFHPYLVNVVLKRRSFTCDMCVRVILNAAKVVRQDDGRYRFYGKLREFPGKWIRVVTLEDKTTVFNIFIDRDFHS
jgi:hypothetical protein